MVSPQMLRWSAVATQCIALTFAIIGVSTLDWYFVTEDQPGVYATAHYSVTGRVEYDSQSIATQQSVTVTLDTWSATASCSGACSGVFSSLSGQSCTDRYNNINGNSLSNWEYNTLCPFSEATLAFIVLGLFLCLLAILTSGLSAVDFLSPIAGGALGIGAFLSFLIAVAIFGGGTGARARDGWWGTNAQGMMGYSYILTVAAMFLCGVGGGLCFATKDDGHFSRGTKEVQMSAFRQGPDGWVPQPPPLQHWTTRQEVPYAVQTTPQYVASQYLPASPPRIVATASPPITYAMPQRGSPYSTPRRVHLPQSDMGDAYITTAPFPNQYYQTTTYQ